MAIKVNLETSYGETRDLYIRVNNVEASNHGVTSLAHLRGFISKNSYESGKSYVWEMTIEFTPNVSLPMWEQVYEEIKKMPEFANSVFV